VVEVNGSRVKVKVGSAPHPMTEEHLINFIYICTEQGCQYKMLKPGDAPEAEFTVEGKVTDVYEYCNLHGLWKVA